MFVLMSTGPHRQLRRGGPARRGQAGLHDGPYHLQLNKVVATEFCNKNTSTLHSDKIVMLALLTTPVCKEL